MLWISKDTWSYTSVINIVDHADVGCFCWIFNEIEEKKVWMREYEISIKILKYYTILYRYKPDILYSHKS